MELLVVIIILGILAAIVVFSVRGITDTGQEAACNADLRMLMTAQEAHFAQHGDVGDDPGRTRRPPASSPAVSTYYNDHSAGAARPPPTASTLSDADCPAPPTPA